MALPHASEINCVRKIHIGKESEGFRRVITNLSKESDYWRQFNKGMVKNKQSKI